jgi:hypothetical protein
MSGTLLEVDTVPQLDVAANRLRRHEFLEQDAPISSDDAL